MYFGTNRYWKTITFICWLRESCFRSFHVSLEQLGSLVNNELVNFHSFDPILEPVKKELSTWLNCLFWILHSPKFLRTLLMGLIVQPFQICRLQASSTSFRFPLFCQLLSMEVQRLNNQIWIHDLTNVSICIPPVPEMVQKNWFSQAF